MDRFLIVNFYFILSVLVNGIPRIFVFHLSLNLLS
jgi:hypothetical protein